MRQTTRRPQLGRRWPIGRDEPLIELADAGAPPDVEQHALVAELRAARQALRQALDDWGAGRPGGPPAAGDSVIDAARAALGATTLPAGAAARIARALEAFVRARNALAAAHLRLVVAVAQRYARPGGLADAIQDGSVGLLRAIERFDPAHGCSVSTYAVWWIRQAIQRGTGPDIIRLPEPLARRARRLGRAQAALEQHLGRRPSLSELAAELDLPARVVRATLEASAATVSLDAPLPGAEDTTLADLLAAEDDGGPSLAFERRARAAAIARALASLPPRARTILELRFGLADGQPRALAEVGRALGLSHERVRRIEQAALRRLRTRRAAQPLGAPRGDRPTPPPATPHER
jgi:RNA polymerase sigma factor (sigma-70 family)